MTHETMTKTDCPDEKSLVNFLLGKLTPYESSAFEDHIAQCSPCEETIRSLDVTDTLSELAVEAFSNQPQQSDFVAAGDQDSQTIKVLVERVSGWEKPATANASSDAISDIEDRASEVQHFFEISDETDQTSLGLFNKYRIDELIGAGSTGVVYRATDISLDRPVAIKFLRPSLGIAARQRFMTEARSAAAINHPNVIPIYEVGAEGKLAFIVMQWLPVRLWSIVWPSPEH